MGLYTFGTPPILLLGLVGNFCSIVVLLSKRMRTKSIYFYLVALAFADSGVLLLSATKTWIRVVVGFEFLHVSDFVCKLTTFLIIVCLHLSGWLIVCLSVDRFVSVYFPLRAAQWCTYRRAVLTSVALAGFWSVAYVFVFWKISLRREDACISHGHDYFMNNVFDAVRLLTYSLLPIAITTVSNGLIMRKLWIRSHGNHAETNLGNSLGSIRGESISRRNHPSYKNQQNVSTYILLSVLSVSWAVLTLPITIWQLAATYDPGDPSKQADYFLQKTVCFMAMYLNHALNFYLYCLTGAHFRRQAWRVLRRICRHCRCAKKTSTPRLRALSMMSIPRDHVSANGIRLLAAPPITPRMGVGDNITI